MGSYVGYWNTSDIDYFVDSESGSDTNDGLTPTTPFKTLSKVKSLGAGIWEDGLVVACWGQFTENLSIDKAVTILGAGGYNGRAVFQGAASNYITFGVINTIHENVFVKDYNYTVVCRNSYYANNCIYYNEVKIGYYSEPHYVFNSIFSLSQIGTINNYVQIILGDNNSVIDCIQFSDVSVNGKNNHSNNTFTNSGWALKETDARYFTDNTETTPADLYIDSANLNFGIKAVFDTPIWDKTAGAYITANPLYRTGTYNQYTRVNNHIGAGLEAVSLTGLNDSLNDTVDAVYTNFEKDIDGVLSRTNDGIDGNIVAGIQDLGKIVRGVRISALHTYGFSGGVFEKHLGTSDYINDFEIQFGKTETECNNMTPIKCEYGKVISYYNDNGTLHGNADAGYDATMSRVAEFRYYIIKITAQTV
jgi:hypothetical protein